MKYILFLFLSVALISCNDPDPVVDVSHPENEWGEDIILGDTSTTDYPNIGDGDSGDID